MRPLYHSFCFCTSLRAGAVIIAVVGMLGAGFMLFLDGMYLDNFDERFDQTHLPLAEDSAVLQYNLEKILVLMDLLLQALAFGFAVLLLLGALKGKPRLVLAWVVFASLFYAVYASRTLGLLLTGWAVWFSASCSGLALVSLIVVYCIAGMLKFYQELREALPRHSPSPYTKAALEPHLERI